LSTTQHPFHPIYKVESKEKGEKKGKLDAVAEENRNAKVISSLEARKNDTIRKATTSTWCGGG